MHWRGSVLCGVAWLLLLCFAPVCPSAQKYSKYTDDKHNQIHQGTHNMRKKFCDPFFGNPAAGPIIQKCSSGFYREWTGPHKGQCVPCHCNGLSNECDEHTGTCVNCQFNTAGDHCERCKEGYSGNATSRTCRACPCPFTWNNFALTCLDVGSGEVDCLCNHGYTGARCERCAHGYYGNPLVHGGSCKPCSWEDGTLNMCDSPCRDWDSCSYSLLFDLEKMDDDMALLKPQLMNTSLDSGLHSMLNISETKILVGNYSTAVRHLSPKVEQLEANVNIVGDDLSQLIDKTLQIQSDMEKILQNVNETKTKADDFLPKAESLLTAIQDLTKRLSEAIPERFITENKTVRMIEEAPRIVQEMRERGCTAQRHDASAEHEEAHKLLNLTRDNVTVLMDPIQSVLSQTADYLMKLGSLRELTEPLSEAEDRVARAQGLNLRSQTALQQPQHLQTHLDKRQRILLPVTEMIKDLLKNITNIFMMLEETKKEFESHAAQIDGAKRELNTYQTMTKSNNIIKAEEHAEQLNRVAAEIQQGLHNVTNSTELPSVLGTGAYHNIINAIEKAEMAANQSREAADETLEDAKRGSLVNKAEGLSKNASHLRTEANNTLSYLKMLSHEVMITKDRVKRQEDKRETLRKGISAFKHDIGTIRRGDTTVLIDSVKTSASTSNATVGHMRDRLRNISQDMDRISLANVSVDMDNMFTDAEQTLKNLNTTIPTLTDSLTQVEALSKEVPPSDNMTESIKKIEEVIAETRNFVNRLATATTFNGKGHIELHPPRNLEDIKSFTAVDLLLNRHQSDVSNTNRKRRQQQAKHRNTNLFVFYLGNKDASGDYIGMAIRNNLLICVYKLGGVVHEVETSQITTTTNINSTNFDRVIFHRVYQDAEVNITKNSTLQESVLSHYYNLPNTMAGVLDVDPHSVVVYVGGYPDSFTPPLELRYPKYRGAMKLSYINDNPVCLLNYKSAVNMDPNQPYIKFPQSEVSDYYDGTGYRMAFIKEPDKIKRFFKFHINSRATDALLFYIGNKESFFCVFVERGVLVLLGQQAGQELRAQSSEKVSLFDKRFAVTITGKFSVQYGTQKISTHHNHTNYISFYIGGLPAQLRQRHNITAPPLKGCVDHLREDDEIAQYNTTIGVTDGCPVSLLGVRAATLHSALVVDSLFDGDKQPIRVSLGFRTTDKHGALLRSSSQGSSSSHDLQLSLSDGYVVFNSNNYTLKSEKRYSDDNWHYLSAVRKLAGLELSIDNEDVIQGEAQHGSQKENSQRQKFKSCIANLYTRRHKQSFIPADLSSFSQTGDTVLGVCSLNSSPHIEDVPALMMKLPKNQQPAPAGSQCSHRGAHHGAHHLYDEHSWFSYILPQDGLNYRPHFSLDVKTKSSKGLILHVAGRRVMSPLALYVANGKIKLLLGQNRIIQYEEKINDGNWHNVKLSVESSNFHLLVDGVRVTNGILPSNEGSFLDLHNPVHLGGDPKGRTIKGHNIPVNSIIGCIRDFKMNHVAVGEPEVSHKTLPCFSGPTEMGTYFGGGHIIIDNYSTLGSHFELSFELRPQYLTGLLFDVHSDKASLYVFLMENKVGVKLSDGNGVVILSVTPDKSLCDGKFHMVTVSIQTEVVELVVDSMSEKKTVAVPFISHSATLDLLSIGGTTKYRRVPVTSPFVGCLRNVKINGRPVVFGTESRVVDPVSMDGCPKG